MKGRPATPQDVLQCRGSRHAQRLEAPAPIDTITMPTGLTEQAQAYWKEYSATLNLKKSDTMIFAMLCETRVRLEGQLEDAERRMLSKFFLEMARDFGMTPLSRQRAGIKPQTPSLGARKR